MPKTELKIKASILPIAEVALGIADKIMTFVLQWSENADKRADKKAIIYAKRMERRIRDLNIEDKALKKYADQFIGALD